MSKCHSKVRVLVVDDQEDFLKAVKLGLSQWYDIDVFSNAKVALESIRRKNQETNAVNCYDVIVSDIRMPVMNGIEFVKLVKPMLPNAMILLMTAFEVNKSEFSVLLPSVQVDGLITKPFMVKELCNLIEMQVAKRILKK